MNASTEHPYLNKIIGRVQHKVFEKVSALNESSPEPKRSLLSRILLNVLVYWVARKVKSFLFDPSTPRLPAPK